MPPKRQLSAVSIWLSRRSAGAMNMENRFRVQATEKVWFLPFAFTYHRRELWALNICKDSPIIEFISHFLMPEKTWQRQICAFVCSTNCSQTLRGRPGAIGMAVILMNTQLTILSWLLSLRFKPMDSVDYGLLSVTVVWPVWHGISHGLIAPQLESVPCHSEYIKSSWGQKSDSQYIDWISRLAT